MNSPSLLRRQIPLFVTYGDIFPRPGEVVLGDGAFGSPASVSFLPKAPSLRELANPEDLSEGVQARKKIDHLQCLFLSFINREGIADVLFCVQIS